MRSRLVALFLIILSPFIMFSCEINRTPKTREYYDLFNTVATVSSYLGDKESDFNDRCNEVYSVLSEYHKLFDIYHEYAGMNNLATVNRLAGKESVSVSPLLIDFLVYAKEMYTLTDGKTNIAIGALTRLWHEEREAAKDGVGKLPSEDKLKEAAKHISIDELIIDRENSTVYISDPDMSLDVGAVGKGYAAERAKARLEYLGVTAYVLNVGGNICTIGEKPSGDGWRTSVRNPSGSGYAETFIIKNLSSVTSGDYERYYTSGGVRYHHIIDEETLYPARYFSSVTVFTESSALADALSTALFCMSYEDGTELISELDGVSVLWITSSGEKLLSCGARELLASENH